MELSLLLIFSYGVIHAFGADHLTVIANFSIGKESKKAFIIALLFAIGHGLSLFAFAKILEYISISDEILAYGDTISSFVILLMGVYLLFMVFTDRISLKKHIHNGKEHTHIWFGKAHTHNDSAMTFSLALLMGIGGVRGMLISLSALSGGEVNALMILSFTLGVMVVFMIFGLGMLLFNKHLLTNIKSLKRAIFVAGTLSLGVGLNSILG